MAKHSLPAQDSDVSFKALDGQDLAGTLLIGSGDGPAVLISSATATERRFYRSFAEALLAAGARAVLTYDYRGIGGSAGGKASAAFRMKDWGVLDFPGALAFLREKAGSHNIVGLGHSYGGLALGLSGEADGFSRYAMVATLNGYYRRTSEPMKVFASMNFIGVPIAYLLGRLPGSIAFGTNLPGRIYRDFARWCRRPDFFFGDRQVPESDRFGDVGLPLLAIGLSDDPWGTPAAVHALLDHFDNADLRECWIEPTPGKRIGHLGFFRRDRGVRHWPELQRYLIDGVWPSGATPYPKTS